MTKNEKLIRALLKNKIYKAKDIKNKEAKSILNQVLVQNNSVGNSISNKLYEPDNVSYFNNIPKIAFTYWDMSSLSFLHFLTLYTFKKHNPEWEVVLYYPKKRVVIKTWSTPENKTEYMSDDYLDCLSELNIKIVEIDFENYFPEIPYYLPEVIKSDMFRLWVLKEVGGMWLDMDTFWINSLATKFKTNRTNSMFDVSAFAPRPRWQNWETCANKYKDSYYVFCNNGPDSHSQHYAHFCQYILFGNKKSAITKVLWEQLPKYLDISDYSSIGTPMFGKVVSKYMMNTNFNWNRSLVNIDLFAPYKWFQMKDLFFGNSSNCSDSPRRSLLLVKNSCCVHWFNGSADSKAFIQNFTHKNFDSLQDSNFLKIFNWSLNEADKSYLKDLKVSV